MNFELKTTTLGGEVSFLDSKAARYIRGAITLDAAQVTADGSGIKKLLAGTFVGKLGSGKYAKYTAATFATLATGVVANNNAITFTSKVPGNAGEAIKVQLKDPAGNDQPLEVTIQDNIIVVSLATGPAGAITSTAAEVIAAVNAALVVKDYVSAANTGASTGEAAVVAVEATALAGADDANVIPTLILAHDVLFTTGDFNTGLVDKDQVVTAIDQARVISARLPVAPDAVVKANMPGITFA